MISCAVSAVVNYYRVSSGTVEICFLDLAVSILILKHLFQTPYALSSNPSDNFAFLPVPTSTTSSTNSTFRLLPSFVESFSASSEKTSILNFFRFTRFERSLAPLDASVSFSRCVAGDSPRIEPRKPPKGTAPSPLVLTEGSLIETGD